MIRRYAVGAALAATAVTAVTACTSSGTNPRPSHVAAPPRPSSSIPAVLVPSTVTASPSATQSRRHRHHHHTPHTSATSSAPPSSSSAPPPHPPASRPVIVLDPGHSVSVQGTDRKTGINVSDYENEPEMRDMFDVAELVKQKLRTDGYRVVMTKRTVDQPETLGARAHLANRVHADLALSIHDQAGSNGGIPFGQGNSIVYYQSVGDYRETPSGTKVYFTDKHVAAVSKRYGEIFQQQRQQVEGNSVRLQGDTGYDLGSRGLPGGNIWIVQLLSHVPWIYNEAGGNSGSSSGLDAADKQIYADGLVAGVEHCVRPPK